MHFNDSWGSAAIIGKRDSTGKWRLQWHGRFQFPGRKVAAEMPGIVVRDTILTLGAPICARCLAALDLADDARSRALEGCKRADCYRLAVRNAGTILKRWTDEFLNPPPVPAVPEPVAVVAAVGPTVNELLKAWDENWTMALDATAGKEARRQVTSMMRVLAFAFEAWTIKEQGDGRRGVQVGEKQADMSRLGLMSLGEALTKASARAYFENACRAAGVPCSWAPSNARAEYVTINRTLCQARCLFTKLALQFVYEDRVELPASLLAWKAFQLLPEPTREIEPIIGADFDRLVEAREALKLAEPKLYLAAKVLTQTGLRSWSVEEMRGNWAEEINGGWWLHAKAVKNGTREYFVPITAELAREIREAGMTNDECRMTNGYCFGATAAERELLVCVKHNAWLKQFVAGPKRGSQGNHRLRKTLASALAALGGLEKARDALGHADRAITEAAYAKRGFHVTDTMRREFAAFLAG